MQSYFIHFNVTKALGGDDFFVDSVVAHCDQRIPPGLRERTCMLRWDYRLLVAEEM